MALERKDVRGGYVAIRLTAEPRELGNIRKLYN
jgi:protein required for attachment to host cells